MITIQSLSVLIKIRNASEPCYTFFEEGICTIYSQSNLHISSFGTPTIKSDAKPVCVTPVHTLDYLFRNKFIKEYDTEIILNHEGYKIGQIFSINFAKFLGKSVLVPIVVAFVTSFIYNYFKK